jgi:hypothetical protein
MLLLIVGWFNTDVSGQPVGSILTLEDGADRFPETSVLNQPTLCDNPEDGRVQVDKVLKRGTRELL